MRFGSSSTSIPSRAVVDVFMPELARDPLYKAAGTPLKAAERGSLSGDLRSELRRGRETRAEPSAAELAAFPGPLTRPSGTLSPLRGARDGDPRRTGRGTRVGGPDLTSLPAHV